MTFDEAKRMRLTFGKYQGQSIEDVASDDEGLRYLDWAVDQDFVWQSLKLALEVYVSDPAITAEIERVT